MKDNKRKIKITSEPVALEPTGPCFAHIREEVTGWVIWQDGPYSDSASARRAAERQMKRLQGKKFPIRKAHS